MLGKLSCLNEKPLKRRRNGSKLMGSRAKSERESAHSIGY